MGILREGRLMTDKGLGARENLQLVNDSERGKLTLAEELDASRQTQIG